MDDTDGLDGLIDPSAFVFTDDMDYRAQMASIAGSGLSLLLSLYIVISSAWIYSVPSARHHLDRVSFRLLLWSMVIEVMYNIVYIYLFTDPIAPMANPTSCGAAFYFLVASMGAANWLCTFIGVNLMLAICFGINPVRARLERWYIAASFFLSFGLALIPAGLGHFGVDTVYQECYFTNTDEYGRIKDFVLDLYLWQILSSIVAAASVLAVLFTLLRQYRATGRALFRANGLNISPQDLRTITSSSDVQPPPHLRKWYLRFIPSFLLPRSKRDLLSSSKMHRLEDKFITIALKISLYPLALAIINGFITAEDLQYTVRGGLYSQGDYVVYCIYYFLYGGRGIFFALLGIFVDPCLRRGLPAAYHATFRQTPPLPMRSDSTPPITSSTEGPLSGAGIESEPRAQSLSDFLSSTPPIEEESQHPRDSGAGKIVAEEPKRGRFLWLIGKVWGRPKPQITVADLELGEDGHRGKLDKEYERDEDLVFLHSNCVQPPPNTLTISSTTFCSGTAAASTEHAIAHPLRSSLSRTTYHLPAPPPALIRLEQGRVAPRQNPSRSLSSQTLSHSGPTSATRPESRRASHPAPSPARVSGGVSERRRLKELRAAADKAYEEIQAQL